MPAEPEPCPYRLALWKVQVLRDLTDRLGASDCPEGQELVEYISALLGERRRPEYWNAVWPRRELSEDHAEPEEAVYDGRWREITRENALEGVGSDGDLSKEIRDAGRSADWRPLEVQAGIRDRLHASLLSLSRLRIEAARWDQSVTAITERVREPLLKGGDTRQAALLERLCDSLLAVATPNDDWRALPQDVVEGVRHMIEKLCEASRSLSDNEFGYRSACLAHFDPAAVTPQPDEADVPPQGALRVELHRAEVLASKESVKYAQLRRLQQLSVWRRAAESTAVPCFPRLAREAVAWTERLSQVNHQPLYGQHDLDHVCRLLQLLDSWALAAGWLGALAPTEHACLILAAIVHDWGMLTEDGSEEEPPPRVEDTTGRAAWLRETHTSRLGAIVLRKLVANRPHLGGTNELPALAEGIAAIGASHGHWPQEEHFQAEAEVVAERITGLTSARASGIAALIAVADLLDECGVRADIDELFGRRDADSNNKAHWLRHNMTEDVPYWLGDRWVVKLQVPGGVNERGLREEVLPAIRAVKNQYRMACLYSDALARIGVNLPKKEAFLFVPAEEDALLAKESHFTAWQSDPDVGDSLGALIAGTVFAEARGVLESCPEPVRKALDEIDLEPLWPGDSAAAQNSAPSGGRGRTPWRCLCGLAERLGRLVTERIWCRRLEEPCDTDRIA